MEAGAIVGIVLGAVALLLIVAFLVYWYWWLPHRNRTRHASGRVEKTYDASTRRRLMATYGATDDMADGTMTMDDRSGQMSMNEGDAPMNNDEMAMNDDDNAAMPMDDAAQMNAMDQTEADVSGEGYRTYPFDE